MDAVSVASLLTDQGLLASVGGLEYIMQLADSSVTSASTKYYIELIQSKALLRNLIETAQNIAEEGMQNAGDMESMMDMAEKQILDVTRRRKTTDFKSSNEVVNEVIENIHKMSAQKSGVTGVATGVPGSGQHDQRFPARRPDHPGGPTFDGQDCFRVKRRNADRAAQPSGRSDLFSGNACRAADLPYAFC